jgi:arginase
MTIALITVPYTSTGLTNGEALAPAALRCAGLVDALRSAGSPVIDLGDVAFTPQSARRDPISGIIAPNALREMVVETRRLVAQSLARGLFPVVVGGECPLLLGCLAAARDAYARVGLLFVDGHEDAWPPHASTTGEAADMELGLALGATSLTGLGNLEPLLPLVDPASVVLLGPRDHQEIIDAGVASLKKTTHLINDAAVQRANLDHVGQSAAQDARQSAGNWWFHLDLDVLSTAALAAVRYPQPGGLSWSQLTQLTFAALDVPGLIGLDLTIYNPDLDPGGEGAARIVEFVASVAPSLPVALSPHPAQA